jgi:integrase
VIQRGDGRWAGKLRQPDGSARWFYGKTQAEVEARLAEALRITGTGLPLPDGKLTVAVWLQEWLDGLPVTGERRKGLKPSTLDYYTRYAQQVMRSEIGAKALAKLEAADLEKLYREMLDRGLSSTSAHHLHAVIHRALGKAVRQGKVVRNVADLVDEDARPQVDHTEMKVLADADFDRFLEAVKGERLEALYIAAVKEGLRQGEILGLHWRDVDLDGGTLAVTGSLQGARRSNLTIGEPKSRHSRRSLALFPETVDALRAHRGRQLEERLVVGSMWVDQDLVFPNRFGGYLSTTTLTRDLDSILRRAGLPDIRFHDLRHSAATNWLAHGLHPKIASERLGHASVGITLDLYSHVTPTMQREAVEEITRKRAARRQADA